MLSSKSAVVSLLAVLLIFGFASALFAYTYSDSYGNYNALNVVYKSVAEGSNTDPVPLFGAPHVAGNSLLFNPTNFGAYANNGGFDFTDSTLTTTLHAIAGNVIDKVQFSEQGDFTLAGSGTANTNASVAATLFVRITAVESGWLTTPIQFSTNMLFSPSDGTYNLVENPGLGQLWQGSAEIDLNAILAGAGISEKVTEVDLSMDNSLLTFSESGTIAYIKKKEIDGVSITAIVPEPSSFILLGIGATTLLAYTWRRRRTA
jgi:hypothetical protein